MSHNTKMPVWRVTALALAVGMAFNGPALAGPAVLPGGAQVANGAVGISTVGSTMSIINTPGAIINWQTFSIGAAESVKFLQQSSASTVLNRVVGGQMSSIMGHLTSNGQVFLINPSGILVGAGAVIDTASFFASTLQMLDQDFLAGRLKFQGDASSGKIVNQGWIRTGYGGNAVLIAPRIENSGIIEAPGGQILLAAGQKVTLTSLDLGGISFEVQAPTDSVLNLGQLIADGGAVKVFAGSIRHSGDIRAASLTRDVGGEIVLKARGEVELAAGSSTVANGRTGGTIRIESESGSARVAGHVSATGSRGAGGAIDVLGEKVVLTGKAVLDVSGASAGGAIRVGGDWQGANAALHNSQSTFVGADVKLKADATDHGDGGSVVVWSDGNTRFLGNISARGGANGGNGGNAEVSGKGILDFRGSADLGAANGAAGNLLLDPLDLFVDSAGGLNATIIDEATDFPANSATVSPATLAAITGNVTLLATRDMRINSAVSLTGAGQGIAAIAGRDLQIGAGISTTGGAVSVTAGRTLSTFNSSPIATTGGNVALSAQTISAASMTVAAGAGSVSAVAGAGALSLGTVSSSGSASLSANGGALSLSNITSTGAVTLGSSTSISAGSIATGGGALTANAAGSSLNISSIDTRAGGGPTGGAVTLTSGPASVSTGNIQSGNANVNLSGTSVFASTVTTGNVNLAASAGTISSTIDNAAGVTASANRSVSSTSVNISSNTVLNATSVSATAVNCSFSSSCPSASVTLSGALGVNVGTVTASAPATTNVVAPFNSINESVTITSSGGSINAMNAGSQVSATNVTLQTNQGSGGGIGTAGTALRVNNARNFTFNPNGQFNVALVGSGPSQLAMNIGVAATGQTYTGTLTKAGQINLAVSATDTTVTAGNFSITGGFDDLVFNSAPSISLRVPNGALTATNVSMPAGDVSGRVPPFCCSGLTFQALPVTLRASGNLLVSNYARAAGSQAKATTFQSDAGTVTLGTVTGNLDSISVTAPAGATINSLTTAGNINVNSFSGGISVNSISSSGGNVSLTANSGTVGATSDAPGVEVTAAGSVNISANRIGTDTFGNPLDVAGNSVSLTSTGAGTWIGSGATPTNPVTAATTFLNINAAGQYNVGSGNVNLANLTVSATPVGVGAGGIARVSSNGIQYNATSDGSNFTLANWTTAPAAQFAGGTSSFTTTAGDVTLNNIDFNASNGGLSVRTNHLGAGAVTQTGGSTLNLGSGALNIQANGAVALDTASFGSLSVSVGNTGFGSAGRQVIGSSTVFGVASFNANTINPNSGSFNVTSRGAINIGALPVGSVNLTAFSGGVTTGSLGTGVNPLSNVTISTRSTNSGGGNINTGVIEANNVTLNARGNAIAVGGAGTINAVNTGASSINISNDQNTGSGSISLGAINASSVSLRSDGTITTGNINAASPAPDSIELFSNGSINTGSLDAASITSSDNLCCGLFAPASIAVGGAIGANFAGTNLNLRAGSLSIAGNVTMDPTQAGTISLNSQGGTNLIVNAGNGVFSAGDGSSISLISSGATSFQFARIDAGATGTVSVSGAGGMLQTASAASNGGIRAGTVSLTSSGASSAIAGPVGDGGLLTLRETSGLSINAGNDSRINLTGGAGTPELTNLSITRAKNDAAFALSGFAPTQSLTVTDSGAGARLTLANTGAAPLNFSYTNDMAGSNIEVFGTGIATNGGNVTLNANNGNLLAGNIDSRGAADGNVALFSNATLSVDGNVRSGNGTISAIAANDVAGSAIGQLQSAASVTVTARNGNIGSAPTPLSVDAPAVTLNTTSAGNVIQARDVFGTLTNTSNLTMTAGNGFVVAGNTALTDLNLTTLGTGTGATSLTAPGQTFGFVRDVPGTALNLTGVTSGTALNALSVAVPAGSARVLGAQAAERLTVSATNTLTLDGSAPLTLNNAVSQNFSAATIATLGTVSANTATQVMSAGTAINFNGTVNLSATTQQQITSSGDLIFTGTGSLTSGGTQTLSANLNHTYTATGASIAITGVNQNISGNGAAAQLTFQGGTATGESITVTGSSGQSISTPDNAGSAVRILGGSGTNSSVTVSYGGSGTQFVQGGLVRVAGGSGSGAFATVTTGSGAQLVRATTDITVAGGTATGANASITNTGANEQRIGETQSCGSFCTPQYLTDNVFVLGGTGAAAQITAAGTQKVQADVQIRAAGGSGAAGGAGVENTNAATEQRIGCFSPDSCNQSANSITVAAGLTGANARIIAAGTQRLRSTNTFDVTGSVDPNTSAHVRMNAAGGTQQIQVGTTTLQAGAGNDSVAEVVSAGLQTGSFSSTAVRGGAGVGALARLEAATTQNLSVGSLTLVAGSNTGAQALVAAGSGQTLTNAGTVQITGGTGTAVGEASALVRNAGGAQSISGTGNVTITSGADFGTAGISNLGTTQNLSGSGAVSITTSAGANGLSGAASLGSGYQAGILQNASGAQTISQSGVNINNQHAAAPVGILASGTQSITSFGAVSVQTAAGSARISAGGVQTIGASGIVTVQINGGSGTASIDAVTGSQTIRGTNASTADAGQAANSGSAAGGVRVQVAGGSGGTARIANSGGGQTILASFVDINTSATGTSAITATGDQWIRTTNGAASGGVGSLRVAAIGGGSATLSSGASQLLQIDYPELMQSVRDGRIIVGNAGASGTSLIRAVDQDLFARSIAVFGGSGAGATAKIDVSGTQNISLVSSAVSPTASLTVAGGAGNDAKALIDPLIQNILVNGGIAVSGGGGINAVGGIIGTGDQIILSTAGGAGNIAVTGGAGTNAFGQITTSGSLQRIGTSGDIALTGGSGTNSDAILGANGGLAQSFISCGAGACVFPSISSASNPFLNTTTDAGVFYNPINVPLGQIVASATGSSVPPDAGFVNPLDASVLGYGFLRDLPYSEDDPEFRLGRLMPVCR